MIRYMKDVANVSLTWILICQLRIKDWATNCPFKAALRPVESMKLEELTRKCSYIWSKKSENLKTNLCPVFRWLPPDCPTRSATYYLWPTRTLWEAVEPPGAPSQPFRIVRLIREASTLSWGTTRSVRRSKRGCLPSCTLARKRIWQICWRKC